jgi:hypothetical protein
MEEVLAASTEEVGVTEAGATEVGVGAELA